MSIETAIVSSIPSEGINYFNFLALVTRLIATLSSVTQYAMSRVFGVCGRRHVLTLGVLCVVRLLYDTEGKNNSVVSRVLNESCVDIPLFSSPFYVDILKSDG